MTRIIGLDLSMARTGLCVPDGRTYSYPLHKTGDERLHELEHRLFARIDQQRGQGAIVVAVIEDYMNATVSTASAYRKAEVHGVVLKALITRVIPVVKIHPSTLKSWAGHVLGAHPKSKDDMISAALTLGYEPSNDDEADAALLHAIGITRYEPRDDWPGMTETIARLPWPELEVTHA